MDPVHVGSDDEQPQFPVKPGRKRDITMIEHCGGVENDFEGHYRDRWRAEHGDRRELDQHRQHDLQRVKPHSCRDVEVEVGMVHAVQPPQQRDPMEQDVLAINDKVERNEGDPKIDRPRQGEVVEKPPATSFDLQRPADRRQRKEYPHH